MTVIDAAQQNTRTDAPAATSNDNAFKIALLFGKNIIPKNEIADAHPSRDCTFGTPNYRPASQGANKENLKYDIATLNHMKNSIIRANNNSPLSQLSFTHGGLVDGYKILDEAQQNAQKVLDNPEANIYQISEAMISLSNAYSEGCRVAFDRNLGNRC